MSNLIYADVPVGKTSIFSFKADDEVYIPLRQVCETLGLDWSNERRRIKKDPILEKAVVKFTTAFGRGQEMDCLPLRYLSGWMFKINLNTVAEATRPALETIQREGYEVLHGYWVKGAAINSRMAGQIEHSDRTARRRELPGLMDRIEREKHPEKRRVLYELIVRACDTEGITPPTLISLAPRAEEEEDAERLMIAIDNLVDRHPDLNHHRQPAMIALRRLDMIAHGITPTKALRNHPRFRTDGAVNSRHGRSVSCWVFWRAGQTPS